MLKKLDSSLISLAIGGLLVIVVGLSVFNYFSRINKPNIPTDTTKTQTTQNQQNQQNEQGQPQTQGATEDRFAYKPVSLPTKHIVAAGEHLWGIANRYYNSGYNWVDIARENNLENPSVIHAGNELTIPKVEAKTPTPPQQVTAPQTSQSITGTSYTVQTGDSLWTIAERAYGNGDKWVDISNTNNLANPNIIHNGNVLTLPR